MRSYIGYCNFIFCICIFSFYSSFALANLINADYLSSGDRLLVFDSNSNLEWLALTETSNRSMSEALLENSGFRLAHHEEVNDLFNQVFNNFFVNDDFGGNDSDGDNGPIYSGRYEEIATWESLFGTTGIGNYAYGRYIDFDGIVRIIGSRRDDIPVEQRGISSDSYIAGPNLSKYMNADFNWIDRDDFGTFIVREVSEPNPASLLLILLASLWWSRRRNFS